MVKSKEREIQALASWWSPLGQVAGVDQGSGAPLACITSTYTFHAPFFESELLPRFLGLKFDNTESERPFIVEREQALGTVRVSVLVDADHVDPAQTTLRWDQLPVRVPGGVQHAKAILLVWEHTIRLIVASANVTRTGYRRNREIAGVLDFYDDVSSTPLQLALDAIAFFEAMAKWVRASDRAVERLRKTLSDTRVCLHRWRNMPPDFSPRELPRVSFVGGLPRQGQQEIKSSLEQAISIWGNRRATEITVMTPFVGDVEGAVDPVVKKLLEIPRTRDAIGSLVVPGRPSEGNAQQMLVGLQRRFLHAWTSAWRIAPQDVQTYVVPLCREESGERVNRDLHAKGILVSDDGRAMLLCGSSNFSPHGMGVGVANIEANLCYLDEADVKRGGLRLEDRLPVDWDADYARDAVWPETAAPLEEDRLSMAPRLPAVFLWATYNQRLAQLTIALDPDENLPSEWSLRLPGESTRESPALIDHHSFATLPEDGRLLIHLPDALRSANITGLRVSWLDPSCGNVTAILPVQIESGADLLPPEEFRALTADGIITCLISGRELAEWVEVQECQGSSSSSGQSDAALDSLRTVETSGYTLYRIRRLGRALATLSERVLRTVRTRDALAYRLAQDPLGPCHLAKALVREWRTQNGTRTGAPTDPAPLIFALAEIALAVAHIGRRIHVKREAEEPDLRPLFRDVIAWLDRQRTEISSVGEEQGANLLDYVSQVRSECERLMGQLESGV